MRLVQVNQGTRSWLEWRRKVITASDASIILGISPYKTIDQLYNEKFYKYESVCTPWMQRGKDLESLALKKFEQEMNLIMFPCVGEHENGWMGASFDGMTIEGDKIVEIKCNGKKNHSLAMDGKIVDYHLSQIQHQMYVAGIEFAFYFSFDGHKGKILEVKRDQEFIDKMLEKEFEFWNYLQNKK